ncbi:hypothetical protein D9758_006898 [Tetrapyrgos nigripes]|uniref:Cytochrome P450 n=1 Tax=Tetrapyrgos nigripes TaxID=182062 RepID=A0A8H5GST6_9AGAR|nr:hypothetical protein D9758_006898 [Tetrapyrgos nigripes]
MVRTHFLRTMSNIFYDPILLAASFAALAVSFVGFQQIKWRQRTRGYPLPPNGLSTLPFIGNLHHLSPKSPWLKLTEFKNHFGSDLLYFHGLGNSVVVLNTMEAITDLFDKRGNTYSHRPVFTVVGELMALGQSMPLLPYGTEWRAHRKLAHVALNQNAVKVYHSAQEDLAVLLSKALVDKPENFFSHVRLAAQRIVMTVTYGLPVETADNEYITKAEETMEMIGKATVPGAYLADILPFLKHLPSWIPFQREAAEGKEMIDSFVTKPYEHVKREMNTNNAKPSLTRHLLSIDQEEMENYEHRVKWTTGAMYGAGGETTYSTVLIFMMLMAMHPDIQTRIQAEVDAVVGCDRLPVISDRSDMPYVAAVIKEVMRWHPVLPMSIARQTAKDDVYNGYFIPAGTTVIPNVWAVSLEPCAKYDPKSFNPDRFLDPEAKVTDPTTYAFGFGRRICPGKFLAENSLFVLISNIAYAFNISPPVNGIVEPKFGENLVSYPEPFDIQIKPRSKQKVDLINARVQQCVV